MGKTLHKDFDEVIFDKLDEWKNADGEEFSVNLIDAFWLMHLDFEHFISHLRPTPTDKKRNVIAFRKDIDNIKHKILEHYSQRFEDDFQNYPTNMLDKIDYEFRNLDLGKSVSIDNELLSKTLELVKDVKSLFKEIENVQNRYAHEFQMQKQISSLADIEKLQPSLPKDKLNPEIKKFFNVISAKATGLKNRVRELTLNHDETEFNVAIKLCDDHAVELGELGKPLKDCLTAIYYVIDTSFNVELILVFLFGKFDSARAGEALKLVIERHERFFLYLYKELKSFYLEVDALLEIFTNDYPQAISNEYYQRLPEFSPPDEPRAILFKLKKLIHLYNFYCKAQNSLQPRCVKNTLKIYRQILLETRFTEFHYAPMWSNLLAYVMKFFGLTQSDLAKKLGIGNHDLTREKQKGTLIDNHEWFWQAATGCSYTYVVGETTIPYYGKMTDDNTKYLCVAAIRMSYAEMFLNYIDAVTTYKEKIDCNTHISRSKFSSKSEYISEMSNKIQIMMRRIKEVRTFLNELENQRAASQNNIPNELLEISEQLRRNLLHSLDVCAGIFEHPVFDCRKIPTYTKIKTTNDKLERAILKRNEAYDLDKKDEEIGKLQRNYEALKKELASRPKLQQKLLDKLEQCLSSLK